MSRKSFTKGLVSIASAQLFPFIGLSSFTKFLLGQLNLEGQAILQFRKNPTYQCVELSVKGSLCF